jgi:5-methylcytosine-specific restriction enzyme A
MKNQPLFVPGQIYHRRREIHAKFGGQEQGGMITPAEYSFIVLVTGSSGRQHGYEDHWSEDGRTFFYFGEGQRGDMKFIKGNLALRDHVSNGEDVFLFQDVPNKKGYLRYQGQMVCIGYESVDAPDTKRAMRTAILFELVPQDSFDVQSELDLAAAESESELSLATAELSELRRKAVADSAEFRSPAERRAIYRMRSRAIRLYVLARAAGKCEGCGNAAPFQTRQGTPYLEPHHVRRLTDGGPDDPMWVVAVCPNCHRRAHYAEDGDEFNESLTTKVHSLESALNDIIPI